MLRDSRRHGGDVGDIAHIGDIPNMEVTLRKTFQVDVGEVNVVGPKDIQVDVHIRVRPTIHGTGVYVRRRVADSRLNLPRIGTDVRDGTVLGGIEGKVAITTLL